MNKRINEIYVKDILPLEKKIQILLKRDLEKKIQILFKGDLELDGSFLEFRLVENEKFMIYSYIEQVRLKMKKDKEGYRCEVDLNKLLGSFLKLNKNDNTLMVYLVKDEKYTVVKIEKELIKKLKLIDVDQVIEFKVIKTKKDEMRLNYKVKKMNNTLISVEEDNGNIIFEVDSKFKIDEMILRKRKVIEILGNHEEITIKSKKNILNIKKNRFEIDKDLLFEKSKDIDNRYDILVKINDKSLEYVKSNMIKQKNMLHKDGYFKIYTRKNNEVVIKVERENNIKIEKVTCEEDELNIRIGKEFEGVDLKVYLDYFNEELDELEEEVCIYQTKVINGQCSIFFRELSMNENATYKILGNKDGKKYKIIYQEKIEKIEISEEETIEFSTNDNLGFVLKKRTRVDRIAVLGSCFTRSAFRSGEYYNDNYKEYVTVPFTYFWFSAISATAEKFEYSLMNSMVKKVKNESFKLDIKREFNKSLFSELKEAQIDYIIIDFFTDAIHGVRRFEDGNIIARNYAVGSTEEYRNNILSETEGYRYRDKGYWECWMKSCDKFINGIEKIIPKNRIILNIGANLSDEYYTLDNEKKSFSKEKKIKKNDILQYNLIWRRMNNYFIKKVPECKIIDMRKYEYIADEKHPTSVGPHHLEKGYYKSLLKEIIIKIKKTNNI